MRLDTNVVNNYVTRAMKQTVWQWLIQEERSLSWLARRTARTYTSVWRYRDGSRTPNAGWIAAVEKLAGKKLQWRNGKDGK